MAHQDWEPKYLINPNAKQSKGLFGISEGNAKGIVKTEPKIPRSNMPNFKKELLVEGDIPAIKYIDKEFSKQLVKCRTDLKLKQQEVANKLNLNVSVINECENGKAIYNPVLITKLKKFYKITNNN